MAWPSAQKERSRLQILQSAGELFTAKGFDSVSIADVMTHAGMTHGAFYAHFKSKKALYVEALPFAAQRSFSNHQRDEQRTQQALASYLSEAHVEGRSPACPLAFLVTDVAAKEPDVKQAYTAAFKGFLKAIEHGDTSIDSQHSLVLSAMMIGGVAVARSLSDPELKAAMLAACLQHGEQLLGS
ncbi:TetR/AcrR family transcriptional regulator [Thaumasiovibrio subtropicus]|uniref:TetR/AcrR family transcriptional regulator n=1 Tax=Thaumasiovibrio subtropicus TaxID=1891207 RepID=UPI000B360D5B|nr:TetR/AcrR family transcriptional regulator [Thaumasiovibrio subtropicus]